MNGRLAKDEPVKTATRPTAPASPSGRRDRGGTALRLILGVLYAGMALSQLVSLQHMPAILAAYGLHSHTLALTVALGLIAGELLSAPVGVARPPGPDR